MDRPADNVLYVTATLPALTVTFIYREIFRLRAAGIGVGCVSMNTPRPEEVSDEARPLIADTTYLDSFGFPAKLSAFLLQAVRHPLRMLRCLATAVTARPMKGVRDYLRISYHLLEAAFICQRLDISRYRHVHAHFINGPTSIAMFIAQLSGKPFSFTMHASMIWLDPIALRNKLDTCAFCASISEYNRQYVLETYGERYRDKIRVVHCGIEPEAEALPPADRTADAPLRLLGVGQLNARKGFHVLVDACSLLRDRGLDFVCTIVGGGEQQQALEERVANARLDGHVRLTGAVKHEAIMGYLAECDLFVLPCVISSDGWRDGIPVALMEAMFHRRPVISTRILGLPELIDDGVSGRLVEPDDPGGLADTIEELAASAAMRRQLAEQGREKVLVHFNNEKSAAALAGLFGAA